MDDATALLRAIDKDRAEDVPRLAYADVLDEQGQPEWAEFIRTQCALARMGPEWKEIGKNEPSVPWVEMRPHGPDFWTFEAFSDYGVRVGDRVDVYGRGKRGGAKVYSGLVVRRVEDHGSDGVLFAVARDAVSKPWPGAELRAREKGLYATSADWLLPHLPDAVDGVVIEQQEFDAGCGFPDEFIGLLRRGFCEAFSGNAEKWLASADGIVAVHPVDLVRLNTVPRIRDRIGQRDNVKDPRTVIVWCDAYWGDKKVCSEFLVSRRELLDDGRARMREVRQTVQRAADPLVFCHTTWPTVKKWDFEPGIVVGYPFGDDTFMARD